MTTEPPSAATSPDPATDERMRRILREAGAPHRLWLWPVAGVIGVAVAGQAQGAAGAAVVISELIAISLFALTSWLGISRTAILALGSVAAGTAIAVVLYWQANLAAVDPPQSAGVLDLRGKAAPSKLAGANLRGALLAGANFNGRDLRHQDLSGAQAEGASFVDADLTKATLRGADLRGVDFSGACMRAVDLAGARLAGATVDGAFAPDATPKPSASDGVLGKFATVKPKSCR